MKTPSVRRRSGAQTPRASAPPRSAPEEAVPTVTLEMVAEAAGVSPSTVSRILNGTAAVSQTKQQAVRAAIDRLGFRPNPVARGLAGGRTLSIGVLTQEISSPFYGESLHGIEDVLLQASYIPLFVSGHWQETEERKALDALLSRRVDGLIVLAGRLSAQALEGYAATLPMVVIGRNVRGPRVFSLMFDNELGAYLATRHLLEAGHHRIAFIAGDRAHEDALDREAGYRRAMAEFKIPVDPDLVLPGDFTESGGLLAINRLLDSGVPFTAIFAANDQTAIGAALGLFRRGIRIPDDVSMVGFDDVALARFSNPPLTTVRQSVYEMGCQAAQAMLDLLNGRTPSAELSQPVLVPRESTRRLVR